jgi:hypothetical protein
MEPTTGIEPVNLILTKDALYRLSYVGTRLALLKRMQNLQQKPDFNREYIYVNRIFVFLIFFSNAVIRLFFGAGDGNRTHMTGLEGRDFTIKQRPHRLKTAPLPEKRHQISKLKQVQQPYVHFYGGERRIRTSEGFAGRFTVCSLWPLGYLPIF